MSKGGGVAEREKDKQKEKEKKKNRNEKNYDTRKIKKNEIEGREGVREGNWWPGEEEEADFGSCCRKTDVHAQRSRCGDSC